MEILKGLTVGSAGALEAPLELGEGFAAIGGSLTEWVLWIGPEILFVVVGPDLGFGDAQAALEPLAVDEVVHERSGFRGGGVVALVVFVDQLLEVSEFLGGEK
jgi:hypothetical protein